MRKSVKTMRNCGKAANVRQWSSGEFTYTTTTGIFYTFYFEPIGRAANFLRCSSSDEISIARSLRQDSPVIPGQATPQPSTTIRSCRAALACRAHAWAVPLGHWLMRLNTDVIKRAALPIASYLLVKGRIVAICNHHYLLARGGLTLRVDFTRSDSQQRLSAPTWSVHPGLNRILVVEAHRPPWWSLPPAAQSMLSRDRGCVRWGYTQNNGCDRHPYRARVSIHWPLECRGYRQNPRGISWVLPLQGVAVSGFQARTSTKWTRGYWVSSQGRLGALC